MKVILSLIAIIELSACTAKPQMYYWGEYSETLYQLKQEPTEDNLAEHFESIHDVMEESRDFGLRVPPGVYAEYAGLLMQQGKLTEARKYFLLEKETYPESAFFMDRMLKQLEQN